MLPHSVVQYQQRLDSTLVYVRGQANSCPMDMQHVYSSYLVVRAAGMIEVSFRDILGEYSRRHGNSILKNYTASMVERENSLNCDKIEKLLVRFSASWWSHLKTVIPEPQRSAVDSIKTLRDQFAHGKPNGTGFAIVDGYYALSKLFVQTVADHIIP